MPVAAREAADERIRHQMEEFLSALFLANDLVLRRQIETWTEKGANGKTEKTSRTVPDSKSHIQAA